MRNFIDKEKLLEFISKVYERSEGRNITLYAVGGTALTLLDFKDASKDIDFIVNHFPTQDTVSFSSQRNAFLPA